MNLRVCFTISGQSDTNIFVFVFATFKILRKYLYLTNSITQGIVKPALNGRHVFCDNHILQKNICFCLDLVSSLVLEFCSLGKLCNFNTLKSFLNVAML